MTGASEVKSQKSKVKILKLAFLSLHSKPGFTLIETLVALTLFSVVVTIGTDLFLTFQRTSRRTEDIQELMADARFVVERIAREVREGTIDYSAYAGAGVINSAAVLPTLHLRNSAGESLRFARSTDADPCGQSTNVGCLILNLGGASERLTASAVQVRDAKFFIAPEQNPFEFVPATGDYAANMQPRVTLFLSLTNGRAEGEREYMRYDVQTTITSRVYPR